MSLHLTQKVCVSCHGGDVVPFTEEELAPYLKEVPGWQVNDDHTAVSRTIKTKNFMASLDLANQIAPLAEAEGHHPDLTVSWGKLCISLTTHAIRGLSENDFILAAKIDELLAS